jgi:hypothetical protein
MMHIEDNLSLSSRSASSQLSAMNLSGISTPRDDFLALSPAAVQFDQTLEQQHQHQQLQQLQQSQQQSQQQPQQQFLPSQHALVQVAHAQFSAATPSLTTPLQIALLKAEASGASNTSSIAALGISPHRFMSDSAFVARPSTVLPTSVGDFDASSPHRHFELVRQPKPKQRKSYRTENRYLAPNPFTVRYRGRPTSDHARPRAGGVAVSLMDVLGRPLDIAVQKELVGGQRKMLSIGSTTAVASFSLKMHVTSRGEELRLAFDIDWIGADGLQRRERVLSDAFRVNTNIRRPKAGANDRSASDDDAS